MRETASYPAARYVRGENIGENNGYIILQPDSPDTNNNPIFCAVLILRRQTRLSHLRLLTSPTLAP